MSWLVPQRAPAEVFGFLWLDREVIACVTLPPLDDGLVWARPGGTVDWRPWDARDLIADGMVEGIPAPGDWIVTVAGRAPYRPEMSPPEGATVRASGG